MLASRLARLLTALATVVAVIALTALPASAATYYFLPGHPMYFGGPGTGSHCTGGYAVRGTDGMFLLTAGHCAPVGTTVYGTSRAFATVAYSRYSAKDTELVRVYAGDDALQILTDPVTGTHPGPGGEGKVTGVFPKSALTVGTLIGKMGVTTGWREGSISYTTTWYGMTAYCATAYTQPGDSGGPVWRWDGGGLRAVGITVSYSPSTGNGCFLSIEDLLSEWGAWLPVWFAAAAPGAPPAGPVPPWRPAEGLLPA